ncbi:MAG: hypothetical protein BGO77_05550 [Caedibacter sp. 37-49]|nr:MAG: hypothetical protein BGO77_05550 [Caedibacter sp. 37-49]
MKLRRLSLISLVINILSTSFCFSSIQHEELQDKPTKKPKIIDYIESGARAAISHDFDQARAQYYRAIYYLTDAVKRDDEARLQVFDLSGEVVLKINKQENREIQCLYTDEWPLPLRAAVVAIQLAEILSHSKQHAFLEAQFYEQAGRFGHNFAMAQMWFKTAAEKYFTLNQFSKALKCITEAGEVSKRYFPKRDSYACLLDSIIELNRTWGKALTANNNLFARHFFWNAFKLGEYELDFYEKQKKLKRKKKKLVDPNLSIIDQIDLKARQGIQGEELKQKHPKRKKLKSESKQTIKQKSEKIIPSSSKVGYISELPPVSEEKVGHISKLPPMSAPASKHPKSNY